MRSSTAGVVEQAAALLAPLVAVPADRSLGGDLVGVLAALAELEAHVDALRLKHLAAFDAENLGPLEGVPNAATWWALQSGCSLAEARADAALSRRLFTGDLTATGQALETGTITAGQARAIHIGTKTLLPGDVEQLEPILLACPQLAPEQLRTVAAAALERIDGDSCRDERLARVQAARGVDLNRIGCDGGWYLTGDLDDETGQLLHGLLEDLSAPVKDEQGNPDPRTPRMRRHDGLREVLRRSVQANPHEPNLPAALVTLTVTLEELNAMKAPPVEQPAHVQDLSRQCCDADLTWALIDPHPEQIGLPPDPPPPGPDLRLLTEPDGRQPTREPDQPTITGYPFTDAILRAALGDLAPAFGGIPTDVLLLGRTERLANRAQRRALAIRDGGCVVPGCQAPPSRTRVHHLQWWEHDGPTDLWNECLLCEYHHVRVHQGWELDRNDQGRWTFTPPAKAQAA